MTQLKSMIIDSNRLTGSIPDMRKLSDLEDIHLGDNRLTSLPAFPESPAKLNVISVERNRLGGPINHTICNLQSLNELSVYSNDLSSLPECLGDLEELRKLIGRVPLRWLECILTKESVSIMSYSRDCLHSPKFFKWKH